MAENKVIDIHIHIGGIGDSGSGCRMSYPFIFSFAFAAMLIALKTTPFDLNDETMRERILEAIGTSEKIDYGVLLALDGVYQVVDIALAQRPLDLRGLLRQGIKRKNPLDENYPGSRRPRPMAVNECASVWPGCRPTGTSWKVPRAKPVGLHRILKACGIPDSVFTNAWDVLRLGCLS